VVDGLRSNYSFGLSWLLEMLDSLIANDGLASMRLTVLDAQNAGTGAQE